MNIIGFLPLMVVIKNKIYPFSNIYRIAEYKYDFEKGVKITFRDGVNGYGSSENIIDATLEEIRITNFENGSTFKLI